MKLFPVPNAPEWLKRTEENGGRFYFVKMVSGRRREKSLGELATVREAIRKGEKVLFDLLNPNALEEKKKSSRALFEEIGQEVIDLLVHRKRSAKTLESAELHIGKHLVPWAVEHAPYIDEWNETTWEKYIVEQLRRKPRKLFNDRKHVSMIMKRAYQKGIIARPIAFRNPDPPRDAGKRLSNEELRVLLKNAGPQLRAQILMGATMGMRKSEILKLAWDRVDFVQNTIHLRRQDTKIRRARTMGMSQPVRTSLEALSNRELARVSKTWVFPSRFDLGKPMGSHKTAWSATKRRAGVRCRFHDLRHTFLSVALLERKLNPLHVAVYAGVSLLEIQKTYLHPSVEDTREVAYNPAGKLREILE